MSKMIHFKVVTSDRDLVLIEEMAKTIWHEHYTPIIGVEQVVYMLEKFQSAATMRSQIENGYQYFLIIKEETPVGYLSFIKKGEELFLSKIYILSEERGHGIGRIAFQFIETKARKNHCKKIGLTVNKNNLNSIKAYESAGFKNIGALVQDIGKGFVMDDYLMEKLI
jgi:RimJ/RimL family protein N-acetyltransferase